MLQLTYTKTLKLTSFDIYLFQLEYQRNKIRSINEALETDPVDIRSLRQFALSCDGFVNNEIRRKVWPKLINANTWKYHDETSSIEKFY